MKKGIWKKVIALSLAAVMGLGLAACSGGDDNHHDGARTASVAVMRAHRAV